MALISAATGLHDLTVQAQRLAEQCRGSTDAYKALARNVRSFRNMSEEVEEALETVVDADVHATLEGSLMSAVAESKAILRSLDEALQDDRQSSHEHQDTGRDVSVLASYGVELDAATHDLARVLQLLNDGTSMESRVHVRPPTEHHASGNEPNSASTLNDDPVHRKLSQTSSEWSFVNRDSPSISSPPDSLPATKASEEKEASLPDASPRGPVVQQPSVHAWSSTFAPDPLTMSIEHASNMILGNDETPAHVFARARFDKEPAAEKPTHQMTHTTEGGTTELAQMQRQDSKSILAPANPLQTDHVDKQHEMGNARHNQITPRHHIDAASSAATEATTLQPNLRAQPGTPGTVHRTLLHSRSMSDVTAPILKVPGKSREIDRGGNLEVVSAAHRRRSATYTHGNHHLNDRARALVVGMHPMSTQREHISQHPLSGDSRTAVFRIAPPIREPPPPPPPPRRARTQVRPLSKYHITNPSPRPSSASSDELYNSSRPSSPVREHFNAEGESGGPSDPHDPLAYPAGVPSISIDDSACNDAPPVDRSAPDLPELEAINDGTEPNMTALTDGAARKIDVNVERDVEPFDDKSHAKGGERQEHKDATTPIRQSTDGYNRVMESSSQLQEADNEPKPPPLPKRPTRYKGVRQQASSVTRDSPVQAIAVASGERAVDDTAHPRSSALDLTSMPKPRESIDIAFDTHLIGSSDHAETRDGVRSGTSASSTSPVPSGSGLSVQEFYSGNHSEPVIEGGDINLDLERIDLIVSFFNAAQWESVEAYLLGYLEHLIERDDAIVARRVRHLLGVCASYKGQVDQAVALFMGVLRLPITDALQLDAGDCAAAYWLGDLFSLQNRRTEALLAYCMAERSPMFQNPLQGDLRQLIVAEQEACQLGDSRQDCKLTWSRESKSNLLKSDTLLDIGVISPSAVKGLLESQPPASRGTMQQKFPLSGERTRSLALRTLHSGVLSPSNNIYHRLKIDGNAFLDSAPWPMPYDPLFCVKNVMRGRFLTQEGDLLRALQPDPDSKLPKSSAAGVGRIDTFTCSDFDWLITTVRACLTTFDMRWSEVANVQGVWFVVRHSFMKNEFATTNYFSISVFKQSFRSGYGVGVCPDDMRSSRLIRLDQYHDKGVHTSEPKRIRTLINDYLTQASKSRQKLNKKSSSIFPSMLQRTPSERKSSDTALSNT